MVNAENIKPNVLPFNLLFYCLCQFVNFIQENFISEKVPLILPYYIQWEENVSHSLLERTYDCVRLKMENPASSKQS